MVAHFRLRTYDVNKAFFRKKIEFYDSFDVTKCLQQVEIYDLIRVCAPCSKLPSNISTMVFIKVKKGQNLLTF